MHRVVSALFVVALVAALPSTASAQQPFNWNGLYAGGHIGGSLRVPDFTATETGAPYNGFGDVIDGAASGGLVFGVQVGWNKTLPHKLLVGGDFSFGKIGYSGMGASGPGDDTEARTSGGMGWTLLGRVGYVLNERAVISFHAGLVGITNKVGILDDCTTLPCGSLKFDEEGDTMGDDFMWGFSFEHQLPTIVVGKRTSVSVSWMNSDFRTFAKATDGSHNWDFATHFPKSVIQVSFNINLDKWRK